MIPIDDESTIGQSFLRAAQAFAGNAFLAVPTNPERAYHPAGVEISFSQALDAVHKLVQTYERAGYGVGHRIALLMENRPEHLLHKLA